jgi:hypothetical protein
MRVRMLRWPVDERFLLHRLRSTSTAGIVVAVLAILLFAWHYYRDGVWSWDLFVVGVTFVVVKMGLLLWYRLND